MKRSVRYACALLATLGAVLVVPIMTAPAGASSAPITIGLIASETGAGASEQTGVVYGIEAAFDAQNAIGGVDGHRLKLVTVDDESSAAGNHLAAQDLVDDDGVFGVIDSSAFVYGASVYLQQQGVPVIGGGADGPEWGQQPNTNMFDLGVPSVLNGVTYGYSTEIAFMKKIGVTKLAIISVNVVAAINNQNALIKEATEAGIKNCYDNDSLPFSGANFTAVALQIKAAGCNGVIDAGVPTQTVSLSETLQQADVKVKEFYYGIPDSLLTQPAVERALLGTYTAATGYNPSNPTAPQKVMLANLKKYTPKFSYANDPGALTLYAAAETMIKGLQLAGKNPTRQAFIKNLRKVSNYTAGNLLPSPGVTFAHFGTVGMLPKTSCSGFLVVTRKGLVPYDHGVQVCGSRTVISS
jgi:branched-chain amino acid transport system substrate-binding protein